MKNNIKIFISTFILITSNIYGQTFSEVKDEYIKLLESSQEKSKNNNLNGAISDYSRMIQLTTSDMPRDIKSYPYFMRANGKVLLNDYRGAISDYDKAIEFDPLNAEAYSYRANAKRTIEDFSGAIDDFNKLILIEPKNSDAYFFRGLCKRNLNDFKGAIEDYDKSIDIEPKNAKSYYERGLTKINLKNNDAGCLDLSISSELGYEDAEKKINTYCK
jgi:tetratricopeptide (TPR) repeat protein